MTKYELILKKIQAWQKDPHYSTFNFSPEEIVLIEEALETIQFLEIIFKARKENHQKLKEKLSNLPHD